MDQIVSYRPKSAKDYQALATRLDKTQIRFLDGDTPSSLPFDKTHTKGIIVQMDDLTEGVPVLFLSCSEKNIAINEVKTHDMFVQLTEDWMKSTDPTTYQNTLKKIVDKVRNFNPFEELLRLLRGESPSGKNEIKRVYLDVAVGKEEIRNALQRLEAETDARWRTGQTPTGYDPKIEGIGTLIVHIYNDGSKDIARGLDDIDLVKSLNDGKEREFFDNVDDFLSCIKQ